MTVQLEKKLKVHPVSSSGGGPIGHQRAHAKEPKWPVSTERGTVQSIEIAPQFKRVKKAREENTTYMTGGFWLLTPELPFDVSGKCMHGLHAHNCLGVSTNSSLARRPVSAPLLATAPLHPPVIPCD
jgi:hypothetical protein